MGFVTQVPSPFFTVSLTNENNQVLRSLKITLSTSNCKLAVIDNINLALATGPMTGLPAITEEQKVEFITRAKQLVPNRNLLIHTIDEQIFTWLRDNNPHYYANVVPIGYGTGNQYHILLKNNTDQRAPITPTEPVKKVNKDKVLKIISNAFDKTINRKKRLDIIQADLNTTELLEQ